jgi:hypothetical protein
MYPNLRGADLTLPTAPNPRPFPETSVLRVQLKHIVGSDQDVLPHFYLGFTGGPPTAAALTTFAGTVWTDWTAGPFGNAGATVTITECIVQDISSATGAEGVHTGNQVGAAAGGQLPAGTCANINFAVARRYRGGKPKMYLPYGTDTNLATPQTWVATWINNLATQVSSLISSVSGAPPTGCTITGQVNVSYYEGYWQSQDSKGNPKIKPNYRTGNAKVDPVVGTTGSVVIGSQRRRNHGGG